ncbi:hypothetical protein D8674_009891 [Pyrus ussuriensis x Pyrus communis]|uniref:Uncharacterized protein n=1 Tax=Pyrus ussuriensis x Pyrus communis TaxID=2448454 RepID=A0A5N5FEL8_9ROSA|nr:hypothetical protein D8674_009891 [Pyrus ussuriensis x Pyrus communis]
MEKVAKDGAGFGARQKEILGKMINLAFTRLLTLYNTIPKRHDVASTMEKRKNDLTNQEEERNLKDSPAGILRIHVPINSSHQHIRLECRMHHAQQAISKC